MCSSDLAEVGVRTELPLLGETDIAANFDKYSGTSSDGTTLGSEIHLTSLSISKTWMYKLADQIDLGVRVLIADIALNGSKTVKLHTSVTPVLGVTISL